jgi:aminoglycoside phosphotransferase (APT) family kinase protein
MLLMLSSEDGWSLPSVETRRTRRPSQLANPIVQAVLQSFGASVTTLRCLHFKLDAGQDQVDAVFELENHGPSWTPPTEGRWVSREQATELLATNAPDRKTILQWFDEGEAESWPALRALWARPDWHRRATTWALAELARLGRDPSGTVNQVKHWSLSSILRFETVGGQAWLKAVPPFFAHEGTLIQLLGRSLPENLPSVISIEPKEGWLLMDTIPGEKLAIKAETTQMAESLRLLATLQVTYAAHLDELFAAGCPDCRLATLDGELKALLARSDVLSNLNDDEVAGLTEFAAEIPDRCQALIDCRVPETLVHGDFHGANVAVSDDSLVLYDWPDACVAHPFIDLATFIGPSLEPSTRAKLSEAYLGVWSTHCPAAELEEALRLVQPLSCLHHAISHQRIVDGIEAGERWEFAGSVQSWLRRLLAAA